MHLIINLDTTLIEKCIQERVKEKKYTFIYTEGENGKTKSHQITRGLTCKIHNCSSKKKKGGNGWFHFLLFLEGDDGCSFSKLQ